MNIFIKWLITAIAILIVGKVIPGAEITGPWAALWVAVFLGLFNVVLRPILIVLTLPINILTLGLFTFIINALMVLLASTIIQGFYIKGLLTAVLFSIVLSVVTYVLNEVVKKTGEKDRRDGSSNRRKVIEGEVKEE
jgi:putative membrane protein